MLVPETKMYYNEPMAFRDMGSFRRTEVCGAAQVIPGISTISPGEWNNFNARKGDIVWITRIRN